MDKQQFFKANAIPTGSVILDEWGEVPIQSLTLDQRLALPEKFREIGNGETSYWIMSVGVIGFDADDLPSIRNTDPKIVSQIVEAILELSGYGDEETDDAKKD
jgi:hypothetical protein